MLGGLELGGLELGVPGAKVGVGPLEGAARVGTPPDDAGMGSGPDVITGEDVGPGAYVVGPGAYVAGPGPGMAGPGAYVLGPGAYVAGPRPGVAGPGASVAGPGAYVIGAELAAQDEQPDDGIPSDAPDPHDEQPPHGAQVPHGAHAEQGAHDPHTGAAQHDPQGLMATTR